MTIEIIVKNGMRYRKDNKNHLRKACQICENYARPSSIFCSIHGGAKLCNETGCSTPIQKAGKCSVHMNIFYLCKVAYCGYVSISRGYCYKHGEHLKCKEENCEQLKRNGTNFCYKHQKDRKIKDRANLRYNTRCEENITYKIIRRYRKRIWEAVKTKSKSEKTEELLGCDSETFINHLCDRFKNGMNLENYGKWHVDHIIPVDSFDLSKEEERKLCFNYKNLQPLWGPDNLKKGSKIIV